MKLTQLTRTHYGLVLGFIILLFKVDASTAQLHLSGFVRDALTGEALPGANVYTGNGQVVSSANNQGYFSLTLTKGQHILNASFVGYSLYTDTLNLNADSIMVVQLASGYKMAEAVVTARANQGLFNESKAGYYQLLGADIQKAGTLLGEPDLMKTLQTLPGIAQGKEGSSDIYVRGGGADQNLLLLDGAPVYNLNHAFGMLSLFNTEAISQVSVEKGGIEAQYGGRLSSVVDVSVREGNDKKYSGSYTLSPLGTSLLFEGPVKKEKCSFLVSARRSWADLFLNGTAFPGISFYDVDAKVNYKFANQNQLFLSFYSGGDKLYVNADDGDTKSKYSFGWGNHLGTVRWNHIVAPSVFGRLQVTATTYYDNEKFSTEGNGKDENTYRVSRFSELALRYHLDWQHNNHHRTMLGVEPQYRLFEPATVDQTSGGAQTSQSSGQSYLMQMGVYADHQWTFGAWHINPGLRLQYTGNNEWHQTNIEPRLSAAYAVSPLFTAKVSAMVTNQPLNAIKKNTMGWPGYFFVPSTEKIKPQQAWQVSAGGLLKPATGINVDIDVWVKKITNLTVSYNAPATAFASANWEDLLVQGKGKAAGVDLLAEYVSPLFTTRLSYTLSKAMSAFDAYYNGQWFDFDYDRRHDLTVSSSLIVARKEKISRNVSATFTWRSGAPFMMPSWQMEGNTPPGGAGSYEYDFTNLDYYEGPNNMRMPDYHRLDISYQTTLAKKNGERSWTLGIYNVYNHQNPYLIYHDGNKGYKQLVLFPIMPFVMFKRTF